MAVPLLDFMRVSDNTFFTDTNARRDEYFSIVGSDYDTYEEKTIAGEKGIYFFYADRSNTLFLKDSDIYIVECYDEIERREIMSIKKEVYSVLDVEKSKVYVGHVINELSYILKAVKGFKLDITLQQAQNDVVQRLVSLISYFENSYVKVAANRSGLQKMPQIRWISDIKLLTTLFHDLMNGQKKTRKGETETRKFIKATIADVERMIVDNFLDEYGSQLNPDTVHTYLKSNNTSGRVAEGGRIELAFSQ